MSKDESVEPELSDEQVEALIRLDEERSAKSSNGSGSHDSAVQDDGGRLSHCLDLLEAARETLPSELPSAIGPGEWLRVDNGHPTHIGRFEVRRRLGDGGFGVVFLVWDTMLEREVALKVPRAETLLHSKTRDRFFREIRTTAQFQHPHIAAIYDGGTIGPIFFIASQYCAGGSLAAFLENQAKDHRLTPVAAAHVMASIADATHHAHERGILHRDIKPSNILLDCPAESLPYLANDARQLGKVSKLVDFGLAKDLGRDDPRTRTGILIGTPGYTAPEIVWQHLRSTPQSDVYSLGATLYHLLTGRPPLMRDSAFQTLVAGQNEIAPPPSRIVPSIPADLDAICHQCLEKEPERRYASAEALADDLRRFLQGEPILARRTSRIERAVRWCRRNSLVATLLATTAALFLIAGTSLLFFWQSFLAQKSLAAELRGHVQALQVRRIVDQGYRTMGAGLQDDSITSDDIQLELSSDSRLAAVALGDNIRVWELKTGEAAVDVPIAAKVLAFADPKLLVVATDEQPHIRQVQLIADERGTFAYAPIENQDNRDLDSIPVGIWARTPQGELLAIIDADGAVHMWKQSIPAWSSRMPIKQPIDSIAVSPDGKWLAVNPLDAEYVDIIQTDTGRRQSQLSIRHCQQIEFSPTGDHMAIVHDGICELWSTETWQSSGTLPGRLWSSRIAFSPDGHLLAGITGWENIALFDIDTRTKVETFTIYDKQPVATVRFTPSGDRLIASTAGGVIHLWDLVWISENLIPLNENWRGVRERLQGTL